MPLPEGIDNTNVIEFKRALRQNTSTDKLSEDQQTSHSVEAILNGYKPLNKADIIAAIIIGDGEVDDPNAANHMMESDYFELYSELLDMICINGGKFYHPQGYNLIYDEETLKIYLSEIHNNSNKIELDIQLISNSDFSDTTIELSFDKNIMFIANSQGAAITSYIPNQFNNKKPSSTQKYVNNLGLKEKKLIKENKHNKETIISAIVSNFQEHIVSKNDIVDNLGDYSRLELIELLNSMIVNVYGKQSNIIINPFTPLLLQRTNTSSISNVYYQLSTSQKTFHTSIDIVHENGSVLFTI